MSAEPNVAGALDRLSEVANRIADERNAYFKAGRAMLAALEAAEALARCCTAVDCYSRDEIDQMARATIETFTICIEQAKEAGL